MSLLLLAQYVPFAIVPAYYAGNERADFIAGLLAVAVASAAVVETIAAPLHRRPAPSGAAGGPDVITGARRVAAVAIIVALLSTAAGVGSYSAGIGQTAIPSLGPILTPLRPWTYIATGLLLWSWRAGQCTRASALRWLGALASVELLYGIASARMAPSAAALFTIASGAVIFGLLRGRVLIAAGLVGVLAWPTLAIIRNERRTAAGAAGFHGGYDAKSRLRMDQLIGTASDYRPGMDVGQPADLDIVRYGLVPRALDPDRPTVATGVLLNELRGGGPFSSYTFMLIGNVWLLGGWIVFVGYWAGVAALIAVLLARREAGPWAAALLVLAVQYLVWMGCTYPDAMIGFLQSLVSLAVAWLLVSHSRRWPRSGDVHRPGRARAADPPTAVLRTPPR